MPRCNQRGSVASKNYWGNIGFGGAEEYGKRIQYRHLEFGDDKFKFANSP
jgi:hypothetical protein